MLPHPLPRPRATEVGFFLARQDFLDESGSPFPKTMLRACISGEKPQSCFCNMSEYFVLSKDFGFI